WVSTEPLHAGPAEPVHRVLLDSPVEPGPVRQDRHAEVLFSKHGHSRTDPVLRAGAGLRAQAPKLRDLRPTPVEPWEDVGAEFDRRSVHDSQPPPGASAARKPPTNVSPSPIVVGRCVCSRGVPQQTTSGTA